MLETLSRIVAESSTRKIVFAMLCPLFSGGGRGPPPVVFDEGEE
jgi:hypothetical protein